MKTILTAAAALMLLAACQPAGGGCDDCEKMAREAKAQHEATKAGKAPGCDCCDKKGHGAH